MEKKMLLKGTKGLLALVLAFLMLFGNGMDVLAATEYCGVDDCTCGRGKINVGEIVHGGDKIHINNLRGEGTVTIDNVIIQKESDGCVTLTGDFNKKYRCEDIKNESYTWELGGAAPVMLYVYHCYFASFATPQTEQEALLVVETTGNGISHEHSYEWVEAYEPSVSGDGLMQHKCSCGAVDDQYIIPGSLAYFRMFCAAIQNAPENATVEWNPFMFRCYTRRMMEELAKRPDVTLKTTYTEADGATKSFTIPAGQALTDSEMFYGFNYLGNLYGWN